MNKITLDLDNLTPEEQEKVKAWANQSQSEWFEPQVGDIFYSLYGDASGIRKEIGQRNCYEGLMARQQVFRTEAEAIKADNWRIALTSIRRYIAKNNMGWKEGKQWRISWSRGDKNFKIDYWVCYVFPLNLDLSSEENAEKLLNDMEPEFKILFDV